LVQGRRTAGSTSLRPVIPLNKNVEMNRLR
jgi:hypothetical protein